VQHTIFVEKERTADYQITVALRQMIENGANRDDILACFEDRLLPVDNVEAEALAEEVLRTAPQIGYLTISNALQWRLQYSRVIEQAAKWKECCGWNEIEHENRVWGFSDPAGARQPSMRAVGATQRIPDIVLEPTCGTGSFLVAAAQSFPGRNCLAGHQWRLRGKNARGSSPDWRGWTLHGCAAGFFKHNWERELAGFQGELLILGNLPWVTNAAVSSLDGANVPVKQTFRDFAAWRLAPANPISTFRNGCSLN